MHIYKTMIRESHLDTFGHVNNATFLQLLEEARWELISPNGYSVEYIKEVQKGPVILEIDIKFKKELLLRENIIITTKLLSYKSKIGFLEQCILSEDQKIVHAKATVSFALLDLKQRKIIKPTPEWEKAITC